MTISRPLHYQGSHLFPLNLLCTCTNPSKWQRELPQNKPNRLFPNIVLMSVTPLMFFVFVQNAICAHCTLTQETTMPYIQKLCVLQTLKSGTPNSSDIAHIDYVLLFAVLPQVCERKTPKQKLNSLYSARPLQIQSSLESGRSVLTLRQTHRK